MIGYVNSGQLLFERNSLFCEANGGGRNKEKGTRAEASSHRHSVVINPSKSISQSK